MSHPIFLSLLLILAFAAPQEPARLEPGKLIEKTLAGGETHGFRVSLDAGQFLRVTVDQRGVDVAVRFVGADGKLLAVVNIAAGTTGLEPACWIAEAAGEYRVEVMAAERSAPRGRYQLRLTELRAATDADRDRVAAQRAFMQAEQLFSDTKPESRRQAIAKYAEAVQLWRALGDRAPQAYALYNSGDLYRRSNDYPKALDHFNQAVEISRAAGDREGEATALNAAGVVHAAMGDDGKAIELYNQALPLRRQTGDREGEAVTLNAIAAATARLGERRKALGMYQQALSLRRETKDRRGEAVTLNNVALTYQVLGEKRKAIAHFNQALLIWRALREPQSEANTLSNLGAVYSDLGDQQKALDTYNQALPLWRAARNTRSEALTLTNMGRAYDLLGALREALNHYDRTLPVFRGIPDRRWEAITLNYAGLAYWSAGEYQKAMEHFNLALPIRRELKDPVGEGATLNNTGLVHDAMGERRKALDAYNQALSLLRTTGDRQGEAKTLNNIGFAYDALGEKEKALNHHEQALKLSRDVGDRMREAKVRYGIARIESQRNRLKPARDQIEQTVKIVESLRVKLASPELRASYRASTQQYYDLYIDVLMRMGKRRPKNNLIAEALQASEQARARSLIELLAESGAEIREGVDVQLVGRERELQEEINDKTAEQIQSLGDRKKADQVGALSREIEQLTIELRNVQSRIRQTSPRYAAITQPRPLTAREIQRKLLDANTVLLEYSLGEERSYLWAVTKTSLRGFTLPKREEIESKARRFYELITARNQFIPNESGQKKQTRLANADAESREVAIELSRMLLGPVVMQLGNRRLLIVADGALQYVPFAALPKFGSAAGQPLIVHNEITSLPSASTLAVLRREMEVRPSAAKTVAVFADPVFEADDERVKPATDGPAPRKKQDETAATEQLSRILLKKSAKDSGATDDSFRIPRLPDTRREAETILRLASTGSGGLDGSGKSSFDFSANRAAATGGELGQYRIVHFATHGFLNSLNPELSGLVMALVDETGAPRNGFLLAPDIYNLKLPATELVVLSACQTGLGKEVRGEGVIGLTRGFMYAGAPRVVVSLWNVSDRATADLMQSFYLGMLAGKHRPAAALRAAQIELSKSKQWRAPYFWAAFTLQGEWK